MCLWGKCVLEVCECRSLLHGRRVRAEFPKPEFPKRISAGIRRIPEIDFLSKTRMIVSNK
jgi:hypothetical protein